MLGVGAQASEDEVGRAFRRAARAAHPDLGGDAAQFDRVQRAYDQTRHSRGREVPGTGRQAQPPHGEWGTFPDRQPPWRARARQALSAPTFAAKVHFVLLLGLCLALLTATGALGLGGALTVAFVSTIAAARPEWGWRVRAAGAACLYLSAAGLAVGAGDDIEVDLPPPRGQALYFVTWAVLLCVVAVLVWWSRSQVRLTGVRMAKALERRIARQWYAAMKVARPDRDQVWQVLSVEPDAGCTRCEVVNVVTGRCLSVLLAGWPPTYTYVVLDPDGIQRAWAPAGSWLAAVREWWDGPV